MDENEKISFLGSDEINNLLLEDKNRPFRSLLLKKVEQLHDRNFLDVDSVEKELDKVINKSLIESEYDYDYDDLELYGRLIGDIDQYRSRLSDLLSKSYSDMHTVDEYYSLLEDVWIGKYSNLSSTDKRKGEAKEILAFLLDEKIIRKNLHESVKNKFHLMNSKLDSLSRKITIKQESSKHYRGQYVEYKSDGDSRSIEKTNIEESQKRDLEKTTWDSLADDLFNG